MEKKAKKKESVLAETLVYTFGPSDICKVTFQGKRPRKMFQDCSPTGKLHKIETSANELLLYITKVWSICLLPLTTTIRYVIKS